MSTKELLRRYNEAFAEGMDETNCHRYRYGAFNRALVLAEAMQDNERLINAATAAEAMGKNSIWRDGK